MAEYNDQLRSGFSPAAKPVQPFTPAAPVELIPQTLKMAPAATEEIARQRIATLEREARALGNDPSAALVFHEIGLLWEDPLKNPRNAAVAYQHAFRVAPKFVANIQAARRLFADVGNWQMVVQLLDAELAATDDATRRAPLLFEKAVILQTRLSRDDEAHKALRLCFEAGPRQVPLLVQLEAHFAEADDHSALVEIYRLLAEALSDDTMRAHYLAQAAEILHHRLQRPEEASQALRFAFALDKRDALLLSAEIRSAEREGRYEELLSALAAEAELLGEHAAPTFLRIAKIYERLARQEDALAALLAARRVSPNEPLVLSELSQIYEAQGRHEDLADVLGSWVACVTDESELVALNLRLAVLYEENLKRDDAAADRYRAILSHVPGHLGALAGLGKLFHRLQKWEQLVAVFDAEIAALEEPRQQAARMFKAAEILEKHLGRREDAIQRYSRCLLLQPGYLPAHKALTRLYAQLGRWADLAALYEQDLLQTQEREETIAILQKMAALYEERLQDLERASECLKRILEIDAEHVPTIRSLAILLERAQRWQELIALQQVEASLVRDTREVLSLHHQNAEILEDHLGDRPGAVAAWERLLSISPTYLPALKALGRLYAKEGRWHDLVRMYRAEAEISPSPDQAAGLVFKVGELNEQKLSDENAAVAAYHEVLTLAPSYFPALRALARIYRAQGAWEHLIEVLRVEAANRTDPGERANTLFQVATIWEERLRRPEMALEGYEEVLRLNPGHVPAIRALERLYANGGQVKELIAILDRETQTGQTPAARVAAYAKLAQLYLDRLKDPARAAKCAEAALAVDPDHLTALKLLERIRVGDRVRRGELRARVAEHVGDLRLRSALKLFAAADRDQPGADLAADELFEAFMANPGDGRLAFQVERVLRRAGDFARLEQVMHKRLELTSDPLEKTVLLMRIGDAHAKLGARRKAAEAYEAGLAITPGCLAALQALRAVHTELADWSKVRATAEAEAAASRDPATTIDAWVIAGETAWRRLGDPDGAALLYRKVLERDPLEPRASAGLEEILASRGGAADLVVLQERRGEAMLAQKNLPAAATEFFEAARAYVEKLQDRRRAWIALDRALAAQPTHGGALELKAQLAIEAERYGDAAHALSLRVQQGGDAQRIAALHLQLGGLYQDRLSDLTRAAAHLQTSLAANPRSAEALERLAHIHTSARNWTGAADALKRLIELGGQPGEVARRIISLARVIDEGMGDPGQATVLYRRALDMAPGDEGVIQRLVELYERMGNLRSLVEVLEQQAQTPDLRRSVQLRLKLAEIHGGPLADPNKALAHYRFVVERDPTNVAGHAALANLYMRDAAHAPLAIEEHRQLLRLEPTRLDSLHALFRLWDAVKQSDKAFCAAGALGFFRTANDAEGAFYTDGKNKIPHEVTAQLTPQDVDALMHPRLRNSPVLEVLRAIGDQLSRFHPPNFESAGIDRRTDRLKPDHAVFKAVRAVTQVFEVEEFEVYQSRRGVVFLETNEPLAVCVGQEVVRRFNAREQKFLFGRAALGLLNKTAVLDKLSTGEATDLVGNAVRIFYPDYPLGRRNDELVKQLKKAFSRKALKSLEGAALAMTTANDVDVVQTLEWLSWSANRAGLLMCGDVAGGLNMILRHDANQSTPPKTEPSDPVTQIIETRLDVRDALVFVLSDEFFKLRQKLGLAT